MKPFSIALIFLVLAACGGEKANEEHPHEHQTTLHLEETQIQSAGIKTARVKSVNLPSSLAVNGVLEVPPQNLFSISAPMGGYLRKTELLQGMTVRKGEVLAELEHPDYIQLQQEYLENEEKLKLAKLETNRQDQLQSGQAGVEKLRQQAESNFNQLQITQKALSEKLQMIGIQPATLKPENISSKISLRAPVAGFVKSVHGNIGKYVSPQDVLFEIIDTEHLHVELRVFEKDISRVRKGQQITFQLPGQDGIQRGAHVYLVGKALNDDHTIQVHGHLDKEDPDLIPGVFVNAHIETGLDSSWAVPEAAIVWSKGKSGLFADEGKGNYRWVEVATGTTANGMTAVQFAPAEKPESLLIVSQGAHALLGVLTVPSDVH